MLVWLLLLESRDDRMARFYNNVYRSLVATLVCLAFSSFTDAADYVVVVSDVTHKDKDWSKVVDELVVKHHAEVLTYNQHIDETLSELQQIFPRCICFVATSAEATRQMVADVHRLSRKLDDDPFPDLLWGILTGYDATNALAIAKKREPLVIRRVASGTELAMDRVAEGVWYCELEKNRMVRKTSDGDAEQEKGPDDTTKALASNSKRR